MINEDDAPVSEGDVVASIPAGVHVPMDIWPKIGVRRPHRGVWMMLVQELLALRQYRHNPGIRISIVILMSR